MLEDGALRKWITHFYWIEAVFNYIDYIFLISFFDPHEWNMNTHWQSGAGAESQVDSAAALVAHSNGKEQQSP